MKVLYIVTAYDRHSGDGITPWLVETIHRLGERGVGVEVLAPSYRGLQSGVVDGVTVHRFRYAPAAFEDLTHDQTAPDRVRQQPLYMGLLPGFISAASVAAARVARRGHFDVIHAHWPLPMAIPGWTARRASGAPLICSFYGVELTFARSAPVPFLVPFLRRAIRTADAVTAISTYTAGLVRELHDRPIDLIPFGATTPAPESIPPLPPTPPLRLLFVGRLVERKGLHYLLEALARVRERRALVRLDIVGKGPERPRLEQQARRLGLGDTVRFHGFVSDDELVERYIDSHAFVLPAVYDEKGDVEGLGVVLIEALSYGRAGIGSEAGGITDIIRHDETGLLVPPGDPDALAEAILELAEAPERIEELGRTGRRYVRQRFGWESVIGSLVELYERLSAR